jgi:hypothetical protein
MRGNTYSEGWYTAPLPGVGKYLSAVFRKPNPTANSPTKAKPAWGVMMSLVKSILKGSMVCRIIVFHLVGYGLIVYGIDVSYRIDEVFSTSSRRDLGSIGGLGEASETARCTRSHFQEEHTSPRLTLIRRLPIHVWIFHYSLLYLF